MDRKAQEPEGLAQMARQAAASASGGAPESMERIEKGVMNFKYLARMPGGMALVVRVYPRGRGEVVEFEPDVFRRLRAGGLPLPRVIGDSRAAGRQPWQYMVYQYVPGRSLAEMTPRLGRRARGRAASQVVGHIWAMNRISLVGYGGLLSAGHAAHGSWADFVGQSLTNGCKALARRGADGQRLAEGLAQAAAKAGGLLGSTRPGLVWGDVSPGNFIVNEEGSVQALLDFEGAMAGDVLANLGYAYAMHGKTVFFDDLIRAWPRELTKRDHMRIRLYALVRAARIAVHAQKPLPTGEKRTALGVLLPCLDEALQGVMDYEQ